MSLIYAFFTALGLFGIFALPLAVAWSCLRMDRIITDAQAARALEERVDGTPPKSAGVAADAGSDTDVDTFLDGLSTPELVGLARTLGRREARS